MTIFDPDVQAGVEARRQQIVEDAVRAADAIILDRGEGTEEIQYLTQEVALCFIEKWALARRQEMLKKDMGL